MKRIRLFVVAALFATLSASAAPLTPEQALSRIANTGPGAKFATAAPQLVYTAAETEIPAYYVFGSEQGGYVITSADDVAVPLLGYSTTSAFDYNNLPEQMRGLLEDYAREIEMARQRTAGVDFSRFASPARPQRDAIAPLVQSHWDQSAPYNALCPVYSGTQTVTGCVATAMAQVMRYHAYPLVGKGSHTYTYNSVTHTVDFSKTPFDWDNMPYNYTSAATDAQNDAVAKLMYACGVSVDMQYNISSVGGSGAYTRDVISSLVNYFDYALDGFCYERSTYGLYEWEDMLYDNLAKGMPILYSGSGSNGGHAFVVDGYQGDGYFHLNWGWSGSSDGYFLITALDPTTLGIGGGAGGFNSSQTATLGIRPAYAGAKAKTAIVYSTPYTMSYASSKVTITGIGYNAGHSVIPKVTYGVKLTSDKTSAVFKGSSTTNLQPRYGFSSFSAYITPRPADGTYEVRPVFIYNDENGNEVTEECMIPPSLKNKYFIEIKSGIMSFREATDDCVPTATDLTVNTPLYKGGMFGFSAALSTPSANEYYDDLYMGWYSSTGTLLGVGDALRVDIPSGETLQMNKVISVPASVKLGTTTNTLATSTKYQIALVRLANASTNTYEKISNAVDVTIGATLPTVALSSKLLTVADATSVDASEVKFTATVTNTSTTDSYANPIRYWVRDAAGTYILSGSTVPTLIAPQETKSIDCSFCLPKADKGASYTLLLNYVQGTSNKFLSQTDFTVGKVMGVNSIFEDGNGFNITTEGGMAYVTAPESITNVTVFNTGGMAVNAVVTMDGDSAVVNTSQLPSGVYLIRVVTATGMHTFKLTV